MKDDILLDIYDKNKGSEGAEPLYNYLENNGGRYRELSQISSGGMKVIYTCYDSHTDREIVLVTPKDESMNELFIREGFINAYLQHSNISPVFDIGLLEDERPYFTSKLISGQALSHVDPEIVRERMIDIISKVCEALHYSHSHSIVHNDLKPDNIMIDDFGEVFIIDWGLAEIDDKAVVDKNSILDKDIERLKQYTIPEESKKLRGTPGYISPQRYNSPEPSILNDIYSVGGLLYFMISATAPPKFISSVEDLKYPPETAPGLKAICNKALSANTADRYKSLQEMLKDLHKFREGYATEAEEASLMRQLLLLYRRNRKFCLVSVTAVSIVALVTAVSMVTISSAKNQALADRDKAIKANERNVELLEKIQQKEKSRQHFMKLSAKNQLTRAHDLLRRNKIDELRPLLELTLRLDPESREANLFHAYLLFSDLNFTEAAEVFKSFNVKTGINLTSKLMNSDLSRALDSMSVIDDFLPRHFARRFTVNCISAAEDSQLKAQFYKWLLFLLHEGMKKMPVIEVDDNFRSVNIANQFSIKDCGPIELLSPLKVNLSNTNFLKVSSLLNCKDLMDLNLSNTPLISLSSLPLPKLKKLNISKTNIKNLKEENFPNLESLNVANSEFSQIRDVLKFTKLKVLVIDKSQIQKTAHLKNINVKVIEQ
ncbi:MAG: protein kinase [Lentisphaeraceae bacterium]|nr:protein kinase [Lentisphaeraceae bacterium]